MQDPIRVSFLWLLLLLLLVTSVQDLEWLFDLSHGTPGSSSKVSFAKGALDCVWFGSNEWYKNDSLLSRSVGRSKTLVT